MTLKLNIDNIADLMRRAAQAEILPRFRRLGAGDVRAKTEATDLVTEGDEAAERYIKAEVESLVAGALFIGEESVAADPALLNKLGAADLAFIVDPIDGTFNFAAGMPLFGVMVAIVSKGETVAGLIFDPMGDDWFIAEKGAGAFMVRPDGTREKLAVKAPATLENQTGMSSLGYLPLNQRKEILGNLHKVRFSSSYRCAAHEYRTFASGHVHFLMYNKLMPWDHLAGTLISQEAGAYAAKFDGSQYRPTDVDGGLLLATDKDSWDMLRREVFTV